MSKLNKMLFREIINSKAQILAAMAVIFAGIAMFASSYMSYQNLKESIEQYYIENNFLSYYAKAFNIEQSTINKISKYSGVKDVIGRIAKNVYVDMGDEKRVSLRLISLPDDKLPPINTILIKSGGYLSSKLQNVCLLNKKFADFYGLTKGSTVNVIIDLKKYEFKIDGIVDSPEFIYAVNSESAISPSPGNFGICYIKETTAKNLLGYNNSYNETYLIFEKDADKKKLIDKVEKELKKSGFIAGIERKDQISSMTLNSEIEQLKVMAVIFPVLFLLVAAMIIFVMLQRIINNQRVLIGIMKVLGYYNYRIMLHYLFLAVIIAVLGAIPGVVAGIYMGKAMTMQYAQVFSLTYLATNIYWDIVFIGIGISVICSVGAGTVAVKKIIKIQPSEAMRSDPPKIGKRVLLEKIDFLWESIPFGWKVSIRNMFRSPQRSFFTIMGFTLTILLFMISIFFLDCTNYFLEQHFNVLQKQDLKVQFTKPLIYNDVIELTSIDGIRKVEPLLEMGVEVTKGWRKKTVSLVGIEKNNTMHKIINENKIKIEVPDKGILLSNVLAKKIQVKAGDLIKVKTLTKDSLEKEFLVTGLAKQYAGFSSYINLDDFSDFLRNGKLATSALLKIDRDKEIEIRKELFKYPSVGSVENRHKQYEEFAVMMQLMYVFIGIMIFFGSIREIQKNNWSI